MLSIIHAGGNQPLSAPDAPGKRQNCPVTYAVVVGEALVDLLEEGPVYRPMIGGGPLNVAVGLARLGDRVEFFGAVGRDVLGGRIRAFLTDAGVGTGGCVDVDRPTSLTVTSFRGAEPEFHFYGQPPSFGEFAPAHLDPTTVAGAATLSCGSIALLRDASRAAARLAWAQPGPLKTLDPNVRNSLTPDPAELRSIVEEFAATADLVKLSEPDAHALFDADPTAAAAHLRSLGAAAVVVTRGAAGALVATAGGQVEVAAPPTDAVDTTGAGDAVMAGLLHGLLITGPPTDREDWQALVAFALTVASLCCERRGGATAMPTLPEVRARLAGDPA
jgi:fructokinase